MTELEALRRVAEAAQILAHSCGVIRGRTPEDDDLYTVELEHIRELNAALDALPATAVAAEGKTVEVLLVEDADGYMRLVRPGTREAAYVATRPELRLLGTTCLPIVPLPRVPEVTGEAER